MGMIKSLVSWNKWKPVGQLGLREQGDWGRDGTSGEMGLAGL